MPRDAKPLQDHDALHILWQKALEKTNLNSIASLSEGIRLLRFIALMLWLLQLVALDQALAAHHMVRMPARGHESSLRR